MKNNYDDTNSEKFNERFAQSENDEVYQTRTYNFEEKKYPNIKDVGYKLERTVSLKQVKEIKTQYFYSCQEVIEKLNNSRQVKKRRMIKRFVKVGISLLVVGLIIGVAILSQLKAVTLIVDGRQYQTRTGQYFSAIFIRKLAERNNFTEYESECSTGNIIENGTICSMSSLKHIKTTIKGEVTEDETYADTLAEYMEEIKDDLKQYNNKYTYFSKEYADKEDITYLSGIPKLELYLKSVTSVEKKIKTKYKTKYVDNNKLESGTLKVKQKGVDGEMIRAYETIYLNDKVYKKVVRTKQVLIQKKDKIIERGTKVVSPSSSVWDRLAQCETGGRWTANTGNGFYGGLQFSAATWRTAASKVGVSAPYAHQASKTDQIKAATWLQKNSGWGQWPACSSKLGLR